MDAESHDSIITNIAGPGSVIMLGVGGVLAPIGPILIIGGAGWDEGALRWADIDKTPVIVDGVTLWTYRVPDEAAKTTHLGRAISYPVPPAAQRILEEFPAPPAALIFSPAASMDERGRSRKEAPPFGAKWSK